MPQQFWFLQRKISLQSIIPALSGCAILCASGLTWLRDPLGESYSAWKLPVDIGWQFHSGYFNYGLLCLICAIYSFLIAYTNWKPTTLIKSEYFSHKHITAGLLCLVPFSLFLLQYLCVDTQEVALLASHQTQALLVQHQFGYGVAAQLIPIKPFTLDISTFLGRLTLLIDEMSFGPILLCLNAWVLIDYRRFAKALPPSRPHSANKRLHLPWIVLISLLALFIFGRAPIGMMCEYQAKNSLSSGNYAEALKWLDSAAFLNPYLNDVAYYHIERGQALYFLSPNQLNDDSRAYLAFNYNQQNDYLDAYQQLLAVWQANKTTPWVIDEISTNLESLVEYTKPLNGPVLRRSGIDASTLSWLQLLTRVDGKNVYGQYMIGRIQYDLHNYSDCIAQMARVTSLSMSVPIQSSAYTYI